VTIELIKTKKRPESKERASREASLPYYADLLEVLKSVRAKIAKQENVPPYIVFSDATLVEMATFLPQNYTELRKISGVGDLKLQKYGVDFLPAIVSYCRENDLSSKINLKKVKRERSRPPRGEDTYTISLKLFQSGKSVDEIAEIRGLSVNTIELHLTRYISTGEVNLDKLVEKKKAAKIVEAILKFGESDSLAAIKEYLGAEYGYGEIRMVLAAMRV
jgi:ATP-dependent DNA helicase RecQ